jgi:hypothetical protein
MKTAQVIGALGVGIVAGVVAALLIRGTPPSPSDPCLVPGPHTIQVESNGRVSCPTAVARWGDRITWHSPAGTRLTVQIEAANLGQPQCSNNTCDYTAPATGTGSQMPNYDVAVYAGSPNPALGYARIIIQK